jgi:hypothetical protein
MAENRFDRLDPRAGIDHPMVDVNPSNWRSLAVGHVANPRPGNGVLLADLVFHDQQAIDLVRSGRRQVSVGYDANYQVTGPNRCRQTDIICNHVAIVPASRCGPICQIRDAKPEPKWAWTLREPRRDGGPADWRTLARQTTARWAGS